MGVFHSKKEKKSFWIFFVVSFIIFVISFTFQEFKYQAISYHTSATSYFKGSVFAIFAVAIPFSYLIIFSFLTMRYSMYLAHKDRYKSFFDLEQKEQEEILRKIFCKQCKTYHLGKFSQEKMIDGMRWVYCSCSECGEENKIRLS